MTMARSNWRAVWASTAASASPSRQVEVPVVGAGQGNLHDVSQCVHEINSERMVV